MYLLLKLVVFQCYVSLPEGIGRNPVFSPKISLPQKIPPSTWVWWNLVDWEAAKLAKNMDAPVVEAVPEEVEKKTKSMVKTTAVADSFLYNSGKLT